MAAKSEKPSLVHVLRVDGQAQHLDTSIVELLRCQAGLNEHFHFRLWGCHIGSRETYKLDEDIQCHRNQTSHYSREVLTGHTKTL